MGLVLCVNQVELAVGFSQDPGTTSALCYFAALRERI
jgi:hypothetical protein